MKTVRTYRVNYFRVQSCYLLATEFHKIHKNTHTPVPKSFLIKLQDGGLQFYQKRDFVTGLLRTFKKRLYKIGGRNRHRRCFIRKAVLENLAKFTGKHLCQSLFFNNVAGFSLNLPKKETLAQLFSCKSCEILENILFKKHLSGRLLLVISLKSDKNLQTIVL